MLQSEGHNAIKSRKLMPYLTITTVKLTINCLKLHAVFSIIFPSIYSQNYRIQHSMLQLKAKC